MGAKKPFTSLLYPVYWPTWIGFGALRLLALLPYRPLMITGRFFGRTIQLFAKRRRFIAKKNLQLCFPDWDEKKRQALLNQYFASTGMGFMCFLMTWWWPHQRLEKLCEIQGTTHLQKAFEKGRGVIFFTIHTPSLEVAGPLLKKYARVSAMYRPHRNPVAEYLILRLRRKYSEDMIERNNAKFMIKKLRANQGVWFAPDQNYGHKNSLFVNFFGIPAATNLSTSRFAQLTGATVIPFVVRQKPQGGYQLSLEAPLEHFPGESTMQDTLRLHAIAERWIRTAPEQYNWMHRRFKDRPDNTPRFY